jgi:hypothetical protein
MINPESDFQVISGKDAEIFAALLLKLQDRYCCDMCLLNDLNLSENCLARLTDKMEIYRRDAKKILVVWKRQKIKFIMSLFHAATSDKTE